MGETANLNGYEVSAAVFLFLTFALSVSATIVAVKAVGEMRQKQVRSRQGPQQQGLLCLGLFCLSEAVGNAAANIAAPAHLSTPCSERTTTWGCCRTRSISNQTPSRAAWGWRYEETASGSGGILEYSTLSHPQHIGVLLASFAFIARHASK